MKHKWLEFDCGKDQDGKLYAWFRLFGWGLHFQPSKGFVPLFSERYGYRRAFYAGPVRVAVLKPGRGA